MSSIEETSCQTRYAPSAWIPTASHVRQGRRDQYTRHRQPVTRFTWSDQIDTADIEGVNESCNRRLGHRSEGELLT